MKKIILYIAILIFSLDEAFAWVETDNYCKNGDYGVTRSTQVDGLFQVNYGKIEKKVKEVLKLDLWGVWVAEWTGTLFYSIEGDAGFELYRYNCITKKPKLIATLAQRPSESMWIATYSERYIVFASSYAWISDRDSMDSIYIYDMLWEKMVVRIPNTKKKVWGYDYWYPWASMVYKTKKGTFILGLSGWRGPTSVIEITPRTGKITEL